MKGKQKWIKGEESFCSCVNWARKIRLGKHFVHTDSLPAPKWNFTPPTKLGTQWLIKGLKWKHTHATLSCRLIGRETRRPCGHSHRQVEDQSNGLQGTSSPPSRRESRGHTGAVSKKQWSAMTEQCVNQHTSQEDARRRNRGAKHVERDYQWVCKLQREGRQSGVSIGQEY